MPIVLFISLFPMIVAPSRCSYRCFSGCGPLACALVSRFIAIVPQKERSRRFNFRHPSESKPLEGAMDLLFRAKRHCDECVRASVPSVDTQMTSTKKVSSTKKGTLRLTIPCQRFRCSQEMLTKRSISQDLIPCRFAAYEQLSTRSISLSDSE